MEDSRIKSLLKKTYIPFFNQFGGFTAIQREAIPLIFEGRNLFLISPAATGKTEAAVAPVVERLTERGIPEPVSILYTAPTRALVNDLEKRLKEPVERTGFRFAVYTGERHEVRALKPPHLIVTTPESLDSILCRTPRILKKLRALIIDELHLIDGTFRGDQMRILINRLRALAEASDFQTIAMSATAPDPEKIGARYMGDFEVVVRGIPKTIRTFYFHELEEAADFLKRERLLKSIVFCNSRKEVENAALVLKEKWQRERVYVHHASLSRREREEVEQAMRLWEWGICVATTTLEVGIDIGDIDAVVLMHPPPSAQAYLQRIGRGCRRKEGMVALCVYEGDAELDLFRFYEKIAATGGMEESEYSPDLSVAVQQVFSILFSSPSGVKKTLILELLKPLAECGTLEKILGHLVSLELIHEHGGNIFADSQVMDMGERGLINSNIPDSRHFRVINAENGMEIGETSMTWEKGASFLLAGKAWRVVDISGKKLIAREIKGGKIGSKFGRRREKGAFHRYLPEELK